ncbi:hypothetical protein FFI11_006505 [Oerskovia sp. KBS0722]|nr:hypothetical protein FFI11_006505 [Oerskovia sp. KBS0722]
MELEARAPCARLVRGGTKARAESTRRAPRSRRRAHGGERRRRAGEPGWRVSAGRARGRRRRASAWGR